MSAAQKVAVISEMVVAAVIIVIIPALFIIGEVGITSAVVGIVLSSVAVAIGVVALFRTKEE